MSKASRAFLLKTIAAVKARRVEMGSIPPGVTSAQEQVIHAKKPKVKKPPYNRFKHAKVSRG